MKLTNLTPHAINVIGANGNTTIAPSGTVARVSAKNVPDGEVNGIPVSRIEYGEIVDLPEPQDGVFYIVSMLVGSAAKSLGRTDLVGPDSGRAIRNEAGQIVGVPGLVRF